MLMNLEKQLEIHIFRPKLDDRDFIELDYFNDNIFIVLSNFLTNEEIKNN